MKGRSASAKRLATAKIKNQTMSLSVPTIVKVTLLVINHDAESFCHPDQKAINKIKLFIGNIQTRGQQLN